MTKARKYFIDSSNLNTHAKNYLGIIFQKGYSVPKNIEQAIIYFNEGIRQDNNEFSLYNLARIYYFGIGVEKNISQSIELMKKAVKHLYQANLFLFFVYFFGDEDIKNVDKAEKYGDIIEDEYDFEINEYTDDECKYILHERLFVYFKDIDLGYTINPESNDMFLKYLISEEFLYISFKSYLKKFENKKTKNINKITKDFYEGLDLPEFTYKNENL